MKHVNSDEEKSSSPCEEDLPQIPLVKVSLENITYKPLTKSYLNQKKTFFTSSKKNRALKRKTILNNVTPPPLEPYKLQGWMGPSGSGKTTLLRSINGLETMDSGQILFQNQIISQKS